MKKTILIIILAVSITGLLFSLDTDEVRELLMKEKGGDILFLSKINLGIPGGENWIANRKDNWTYIYTISSDKEVKYITSISFFEKSEVQVYNYVDLEYDILGGVPGTKIGSKAAKFGDFNGDGKDEIFDLGYSNDNRCAITGYDYEKRKMLFLFRCTFEITSSKGPPPVIFTKHQGTDGIAVYTKNFPEEQYLWYYFEWNEKINEYEEIKEISEDEIDFSIIAVLKETEENQNEIEPETAEYTVITSENEQLENASSSVIENKNTRFIILIALITSIIAASAVIILLTVRKKRKI